MKPIQLISFRRSGTHLLLETLKQNFDLEYTKTVIAHPSWDLHNAVMMRHHFTAMYIYRDGRDVIKSLYNFFRKSNWRKWSGEDANMDVSFSEFLRGVSKTNTICPTLRSIFNNPIQAWVDNTYWITPINHNWVKGPIFNIRYEDLVQNPVQEICRISEYLGVRFEGLKPVPVTKKVGPVPTKDKIEYTDDDMELFWDIAGKRMMELGYEV